MENYQLTAIRNALDRCIGLRDGIKEGGEFEELHLGRLERQTGIRFEYLQQNLSIIRNL